LKAVSDAQGFVQMLDLMAAELTNDFWAITLPADLESSSARNPQLFAYLAAQKRLNTPVLVSHKKVGELIDPALAELEEGAGTPPSFPRAWLEKTGITDLKLVNQMANQALLGWPDNIAIGDSPPKEYVPRFGSGSPRVNGGPQDLHALPDNVGQGGEGYADGAGAGGSALPCMGSGGIWRPHRVRPR
jgi:hypothetical protein